MVGHWTLPANLTAARAAREHVAEALLGRPEREDATIVASELAANAVLHGEPPFELFLEVNPSNVLVTVSNHGDDFDPRIARPHPDADHGRGLDIVRALAEGVGHWREGTRLAVWARLRTPT
jgi:serine/threonine-protein kinase RsbW